MCCPHRWLTGFLKNRELPSSNSGELDSILWESVSAVYVAETTAFADYAQLLPPAVFLLSGSPASLQAGKRRGGRTMKRTILGITLMGLMGAGSLMAQDRNWQNPYRDLRHDRVDRRSDYRDMRNDRAEIAQDRRELRQDLRQGNYAGAREERRELNGEYRDLNRDRIDAHRDTRDIRNDRFWFWR